MNVDSTSYYMIKEILRIDIDDIALCFLYCIIILLNTILPTVYMYYKFLKVFKFLSQYTLYFLLIILFFLQIQTYCHFIRYKIKRKRFKTEVFF